MPFDTALGLSPFTLVLSAGVIFLASAVRGFSGFGFSAILMAGLLPVIPVSQLVPLSIALEVLASVGQAPRVIPDINRRFLAILLGASLVGVPAGVYLLSYFSEQNLRYIVYSIIFLSTLVLLIAKTSAIRITHPRLFLAGLIAGTVNGATSLSGLVLALFFTSSAITSKAMRATMIAYLFFTDVLTGGILLVAGHYDSQTIWRVVVAIPILFAGIWLGTRYFRVTSTETFKTKVMWLLLLFCTAGVVQMLLAR